MALFTQISRVRITLELWGTAGQVSTVTSRALHMEFMAASAPAQLLSDHHVAATCFPIAADKDHEKTQRRKRQGKKRRRPPAPWGRGGAKLICIQCQGPPARSTKPSRPASSISRPSCQMESLHTIWKGNVSQKFQDLWFFIHLTSLARLLIKSFTRIGVCLKIYQSIWIQIDSALSATLLLVFLECLKQNFGVVSDTTASVSGVS